MENLDLYFVGFNYKDDLFFKRDCIEKSCSNIYICSKNYYRFLVEVEFKFLKLC